MATDSIADVWMELIASRRQRQKCADDVEELKRDCERDCGKKHIIECEKCYKQVLERMRQRYAESSEKEWFSERKAFISELDGAFNDTKNYQKNVESIEASIEAEKEAWYRWVFRKNPEYLQVADDSPALQQLRDLLDDPECSRDELVTAMWRGVGKPENWEAKLEDFLSRVDALNGNEEELRKMYLPEFFLDEAGQPLEHAEGCCEEFRDDPTKTIQDIATSIALDNQRARSAQPQRDNQVKRLDELRRAKTAFEQNRLQAKRLLSQAQNVVVRDEFRALPPCVVCGNMVLREDVISCSLCQTILQLGGDVGLTLYCTDECFQEGHQEHIDAEHECASGRGCVLLMDDDEDDNMEAGFSEPIACKDCLGRSDVMPFCSLRCADLSIARHRLNVHGVKTDPEEARDLMVDLTPLIEETLDRENPGLRMTDIELELEPQEE